MKTGKRKSTTGSVLANLAGKSLLAAAAFALVGGTAQAGSVVTARDWINIDDAGNAADGTYGAVAYEYRISSIATTVADWDAFYNDGDSQKVGSFAVSDPDGGTALAYDRWIYGNLGGVELGKDSPVVHVSMYQAAQYANWLTTGNATEGAYTIDGSSGNVTGIIDRDSSAMDDLVSEHGIVYALPTENEWYKAAYYDPDKDGGAGGYWLYADGTDDTTDPEQATASTEAEYLALDENSGWNYDSGITALRDGDSSAHPWEVATGTREQNDTYDMMGNVYEWQEDLSGVARGGSYNQNAGALSSSNRATASASTPEYIDIGFRVVAIPEPATGIMFVLGAGLAAVARRRRWKKPYQA